MAASGLWMLPALSNDGVGMCDTATFVELPQLTPLTGAFDQSYDRVQDSCRQLPRHKPERRRLLPTESQRSTEFDKPSYTLRQSNSNYLRNREGVAGAVLTYNYFDGPDQKVTTAGAGSAYSFTVPDGSTGTVTPSKPGYVFTPPSKAFPNIAADQPQDFAAAPSPATATPIPGYLSVLINEVGYGGTSATANDQWIELYNPNPWNINVTNWILTGVGGSPGRITLTGVIRANCFLVIERNATVFQTPLPLVDGCRARTLVDSNFRLSTYGAALTLSSNIGALIDTANHDGGPWPAGVQNPDSGVRETKHGAPRQGGYGHGLVHVRRAATIAGGAGVRQGQPRCEGYTGRKELGQLCHRHTFSGADAIQDADSPAADAIRAHGAERVPAARRP